MRWHCSCSACAERFLRLARPSAQRGGTMSATLEMPRPATRPRADDALVREILFPSDLTATSDRAFAHAALLAERLGARLTLFHVVRGDGTPGALVSDPERQSLARQER